MGDMTSLAFVQMLQVSHQEVIWWSLFGLCKCDVSFVFTLTEYTSSRLRPFRTVDGCWEQSKGCIE